MIEPKIIQVPDYSGHVGKKFVVLEDFLNDDLFNRPILKGVRFKIKRISGSRVTVKIISTKKQLRDLGMLKYDIKRITKELRSYVDDVRYVVKLWEDSPEFFVEDENSNNSRLSRVGRKGKIINTGSTVPADHPNKAGAAGSGIYTLDYRRIDNKTNQYAYQWGTNQFYSKACYEFILKSRENDLKEWKERTNHEQLLSDMLLSEEITIEELNQLKFKLI